MGRQPLRRLRRIDTAAMRRERAGAVRPAGRPDLDPDRPARGLSIADQQLVEIAKALSFDARVLVMDEPTAALSGVEVERLFAVVRSLRAAGAAVLFISHRFDEVFALCQRITVLRDGRWVSTRSGRGAGRRRRWCAGWSGREVSPLYPKRGQPVRRGGRAGRPRADPAGRLRRRQFRGARRARSWPWPAWSAPAAARWSGRCSASTGTTPARSRSTGGGCRPAARPRRWRPGSRWCRRTGGSRAW